MAISCEKVYSGTGDQIYPETADKAVTVLAANTTLDIYLADLSKKISNMQGADQIAKSLRFKIDYLATNTANVDEVKELGTFKASIDFGNGNETEVEFEVIAE